jgi:hypothetical protein
VNRTKAINNQKMRLKKYRLSGTKKKYSAEDCLFKILINPKTPSHFYDAELGDRSESEIEKWQGLYYATGDDDKGYTLWCLDGGCWDRPTMHGVYDDFTGVIGRVSQNLAANKQQTTAIKYEDLA